MLNVHVLLGASHQLCDVGNIITLLQVRKLRLWIIK